MQNEIPANKKPFTKIKRFLPLFLIIIGVVGAYAFDLHEHLSLNSLSEKRVTLKEYVEVNPILSSVIYMAVYALAVAFSFPAASLLTIISGFIFGWFHGGLMTVFAATLGATAIFLAAKTAFSDLLRKKAGKRLSALTDGFSENAFNYLLILRLAPIFPFFLVNIAPAFLKVSLRDYVSATFIGIMPGTFAYAYLGRGLESVISSASEAGRDLSITDIVTPQITGAFAALAVVATIPLIIKKIQNNKSRT